jgi:hypothetical protein|uniref:Uncharacterized protein n=1 Tax=viral metagenome TaxID=1070528 RepID=A0A6C0CJB2_9ZZZZ
MAKCPPGVICFENFTFIFVIFALIIIIYFMYSKQNTNEINISSEKTNTIPTTTGLFPRPSYSFSNVQQDVLLNPYSAPLRDERYIQSTDIRGGVPINIGTQSIDTNYRQVGLLKRMNGPEMLLPLMGRPLFVARDKWQYYTMSDKNNAIKLPVSFKSKSCTNEYGCDEISNGDTVYVDGIDAPFQVTLYDNAVMKYIPFI